MNALSTIAAAVKSSLAAASFPLAFEIQRCYVPPDYETEATDELRILVIAFEEDVDLHGPNTTRTQCDHVYGVKVAIVKRVQAADVTSEDALLELDGLGDFRESVIDFLKNRTMADATLDSLKNAPATYDPPTLDQKKTFVSVVALTYRLLR